MPLNKIIAERHGGASPGSDSVPGDDGRPESQDEETSFRTRQMLPPWLHNQTMGDRSVVVLIGSGMGIVWLLEKVR